MATPRARSITAKFLEMAAPRAPGGQCTCCRFRGRAALEKECALFLSARQAGETRLWRHYLPVVLRGLAVPVRDWKSIARHLENCLGWTLE